MEEFVRRFYLLIAVVAVFVMGTAFLAAAVHLANAKDDQIRSLEENAKYSDDSIDYLQQELDWATSDPGGRLGLLTGRAETKLAAAETGIDYAHWEVHFYNVANDLWQAGHYDQASQAATLSLKVYYLHRDQIFGSAREYGGYPAEMVEVLEEYAYPGTHQHMPILPTPNPAPIPW